MDVPSRGSPLFSPPVFDPPGASAYTLAMKPKAVPFLVAVLFLSLAFSACGRRPPGPAKARAGKELQIAVIPKGTTHEFWKSIHAGAVKAALELGVEIIWKGPQKEDDRAQQITVVEDFISRGVDGIVLAPLDDRALMRPVQDAAAERIPVVIIDSALQGSDYVSYVATDNSQGGVLGARRLGRLMNGKGKIFLIRYQEGSASTTQREAGFLDTVKKEFPGLTLLVQDQYAGATTETAYQLAENLISRFPDVEGIFAPNESSTFGVLRALQEAGLAGKVKFVGFDSSPKLVQGLRDGDLLGLVLQNPMKIGYLGVKTMVAYLRGEKVPKVIDTGVTLVTAENMGQPEIKSLLEPDFSKYLDR
jgi:ribose transport system substrate-binding protein